MSHNQTGRASAKDKDESQLIGSILHDNEEHSDFAHALAPQHTHDALPDTTLIRATSAPPHLSGLDEPASSGEATGPDDIRLTEEYYAYYYSLRPLDPRLPRPLFNFKYQRISPNINISSLNGPAMASAAIAAQAAAEAKNRARANGDSIHVQSSTESINTFEISQQLGQLSFSDSPAGGDEARILSPTVQPQRPASGQAGFLQRVASPPISSSNRSSSNLDGFSFAGAPGVVGGLRPITSPTALGPLPSPTAGQSPMMAVMGYGSNAAVTRSTSETSPSALGQGLTRNGSALGIANMGLNAPLNSPSAMNSGGSRSPTTLNPMSPLAPAGVTPWMTDNGAMEPVEGNGAQLDDMSGLGLGAQQPMNAMNMQQLQQMFAMFQLQQMQQMSLNPMQMQQMQQQMNPLMNPAAVAMMNPMLAGQMSPMSQAQAQLNMNQMQQLMSQMSQMGQMMPGMQSPMGMGMMGMNMMAMPGMQPNPAANMQQPYARGNNMNSRGGSRQSRRGRGGYGGWSQPNPMFDNEEASAQELDGTMAGGAQALGSPNSPYGTSGSSSAGSIGGATALRSSGSGKLRPGVNPLLGMGMGMDSSIGGGLRKSGDDTGFGFTYTEDQRMNRSPRNNRRNAWLDEFRLNKGNSNMTLQHVVDRGLVVELATDQYGSRFIQQRLESASPDEKQAAFLQLLPETLTLCTDVFGNYVVQKFLEFGTMEQKKLVINKLLGSILPLSLQMYGCRVVQKSIDVADLQQQALIVRELVGHVMQCVKDQNGNHVIQKCIEKVPSQLIQFIVEAFVNQIYHLSTHPYGCRVIQRLLEHCSEEQRNSILSEILDNTHELCKNQYGNYVIQHVLIHGTPWHKGAVMQSLRGTLLALSKHKFASNVIEKCFAHANRQDRAALLEEVLGKDEDNNSPLIAMVKDQFANYVIQTMIDVVDDEQREMIVNRIRRHVPNLRKIPYGKHIISRIERLTGKPILP